MASGNTRTDKVRCLGDLSCGTGKRLRAVKMSCVVVGMIAMIGLCDLIKQPSTANAAMNPQGVVQVAQLFKSREQRFKERKKYLLDKLTRIRKEVRAEDGGKFYSTMQEDMVEIIKSASCKEVADYYQLKNKLINDDMSEKKLFFYQYSVADIGNKKVGEYIYIPEICAARGEVWCELTVGLFVCIIDPSIPKKSTLDGVAVPKANENMGIMRIPVKYIFNALGGERVPENIMIYENAMKYVYKFFEGEISKQELDAVTAEIVDKGKYDITYHELSTIARGMEAYSKEQRKMFMEAEKACYFPDLKMGKKFNGKDYTFKYDNSLGYIIIDFPLD